MATFSQALSVRPKVSWEATERGMCSIQDRELGEGRVYRRLTEVLGAQLTLTETPGGGCTFTLVLPQPMENETMRDLPDPSRDDLASPDSLEVPA